MPRGFYGRGRGFWGVGRGVGNPYPFCRFYPWLPRGWWRCSAPPYDNPYARYSSADGPWAQVQPPTPGQPVYPYRRIR